MVRLVYDARGEPDRKDRTGYYPNSSRLRSNGVYGYVYDANGNLIRKGTSFTVTGDGIELKDEGEYWEYR